MKIIFSGGGTGGHIYPAVAIIEELKSRMPDVEVLYIGTKDGLEASLIPELGIEYRGIEVAGLPRTINKKTFIAANKLFKGLKESKKIIREFNPDVVFGTGGFVSGPVLYNAAKSNALSLFHEQNSFPGLTNRILSRYMDRYFVTFEESKPYFKNQDRMIFTGNPIRNRFEDLNPKKDDLAYFGLTDKKKTIFLFGGSNGSQALNAAMLDLVETFKEKMKDFQWIHVTGKRYFDDFSKALKDLDSEDILKPYAYLENIDRAYNVSDLVVTSSGAITLAELSFLGLPAILVPKAYTTENHQEYNARAVEKKGAARMILEKNLTGAELMTNIEDILKDESILNKMSQASKAMAKPDAAKEIVDIILESRW